MKPSKLFALVSSLSKSEVKSFLHYLLQKENKKRLAALFQLLSSQVEKGEPKSDLVFHHLYKKKYQKSLDYLLRNEYRLLFKKLSCYLIKNRLGNTYSSTEILSLLLERKLYDHFEKDWKTEWKQAVEKDHLPKQIQLIDLLLDYHLNECSQNLSNAEIVLEWSNKKIELLQKKFLRDVRSEEIHSSLAGRIIESYRKVNISSTLLKTVDLESWEEKDDYTKYLRYRIQVNSARGTDKIELLKNFRKYIPIIKKYEENPEESIIRFPINLALEFYVIGDFKNSVKLYREVMKKIDVMPKSLKVGTVLNYIMALIRNSQIEEAKSVAMLNESILLNGPIIGSRSNFVMAIIYLFCREPKEASKYIKIDSKKEGSEFYFFMRMAQSIIYYLQGDFVFALREIVNLEQAINYQLSKSAYNHQTNVCKFVSSYLKRFYTLLNHPSDKNFGQQIEMLMNEVSKTSSSHASSTEDSVLLQWLYCELQIVLKKV